MTEVKKFNILYIKVKLAWKPPKTHAAKGGSVSNRAWCGAKFKRTQIEEKKKQTIEFITCQKCLNTINNNLNSIIGE